MITVRLKICKYHNTITLYTFSVEITNSTIVLLARSLFELVTWCLRYMHKMKVPMWTVIYAITITSHISKIISLLISEESLCPSFILTIGLLYMDQLSLILKGVTTWQNLIFKLIPHVWHFLMSSNSKWKTQNTGSHDSCWLHSISNVSS